MNTRITVKACLFGGTLVSAGITNTLNAAPQFQWGQNNAAVAYAAYGSPNLDSFSGTGNGSILAVRESSGYGYGYSQPTIDSKAYAAWDENGHAAGTIANGYNFATLDNSGPGYAMGGVPITHAFAVSEDAWLDIAWNFANATQASLSIIDLTTMATLFSISQGSDGTDSIVLNAGGQYSLVYLQTASSFTNGPQTNTHQLSLREIPAPGAAALLALAGFSSARRRRA